MDSLLDGLVVGDETALYADAAYIGPRTRALIARMSIQDQVQRRGTRGQTISICSCRSRLKLAVNDLLRLMRGDSSHKTQHELPQLNKRYWDRRFWDCGYFSTTNGTIT